MGFSWFRKIDGSCLLGDRRTVNYVDALSAASPLIPWSIGHGSAVSTLNPESRPVPPHLGERVTESLLSQHLADVSDPPHPSLSPFNNHRRLKSHRIQHLLQLQLSTRRLVIKLFTLVISPLEYRYYALDTLPSIDETIGNH